jgi:hypothetical protein
MKRESNSYPISQKGSSYNKLVRKIVGVIKLHNFYSKHFFDIVYTNFVKYKENIISFLFISFVYSGIYDCRY